MSFAKLLYQLPAERLQEITRRRAPGLRAIPRINDKRELATFLAEALSTSDSVSSALDDIDLLQLQVLIFAIARGGSLPFDSLVKEAGEPAREMLRESVQGLEESGLVIPIPVAAGRAIGGDAFALFVPEAVRHYTPLPLPLRYNLPDSLLHYNAETIAHIYSTLGLPVGEATNKGARAAAIAKRLTDSAGVRRVVGELPESARQVLDYMLAHGGAATLSDLALRLEARQRNQLYSYDWSRRWSQGKPRNGVEELLARGLLVLEDAVGWGYGHIVMPGNVLDALLGRTFFSDAALGIHEWQTLPAESANLRRHDTLLRDIAYLMGYLGRAEAARTAKGNIHRTALKAISKGMSIPDPEYAGFVYALAREADLIAPQGRHELYDVTEQGLAFLEQPPATQLRILAELWRQQTAWAEGYEEPLTEGGAYYDAESIRSLRECAITLLTDLARERPGEAASLRSLAQRAHFRWWSRFGRPTPADKPDPAESVLTRLCAGSLFWLGVTEAQFDSHGRPTHVRLSSRGAARFLGGAADSESAEETVHTFVVQPNLEIYAPPSLAPALLYRLFKIADAAAPGAMLVLARETLRKSLDRGETAEGVLKFLQKHSQTGVPQNVEYLIRDVGGKHGHIRVGQAGIYLQVTDPMLLKEIQAQKKLNIRFRGKLADTVALVTGDSVDSILKQLRTAGYFPVAADDVTMVKPVEAAPPRRAYTPPKSLRVTPSQIEARIDWEAVAVSDGQPWESDKITGESGAHRLGATAHDVVSRAVKENLAVAIRYQPDPRSPDNERIVEPIGIAGSLLRAYDRGKRSFVLFNTRYITAARLTGEKIERKG